MADALRVRSGAARKVGDRTTIAHLSDLHFLASSLHTADPWSALLQDLGRQSEPPNIDVIVVTGDVIDGSLKDLPRAALRKAFENARDFLLALCNAAGIQPDRLFVVPGNHDVRATGIFRRGAQAELFTEILGDYFQHAYLPELRCLLFPFDSNTSVSPLELAAGSVRPTDFPRFATVIDSAEKVAEWSRCARIALVHHHPMPIAATEHRNFENLEEYLLLRNAGMFMTELVRRNFDLILHGHKHYPSASRATFFADDGRSHSIAVVAGGSVGKDGKRAVCYNLVRFHDNGTVDLERRAKIGATYQIEAPTPLIPYELARVTRFERLAKALGSDVVIIKHLEKIDAIRDLSGDDYVEERYEEVRAATEVKVRQLEEGFGSSSAYIDTPVYESAANVRWEWSEAESAGSRMGATIFDTPLGTQPVNYERRMRFANAFLFWKRDRLDATDQKSSEELVQIRIGNICERLTMAVCFPERAFPARMRLLVKNDDDERDYAEEQYCSRFVTRIEPSHTFTVVIEKPLPRHNYGLVWELPSTDPTEPKNLSAGQIQTAEYIGETLTRNADEESIVTALEALRRGFAEFEDLRDYDVTGVDISLFLYDTAAHGLRCFYTTAATDDPIRTRIIKVGRDIVGQAWKRRSVLAYVAGVGGSDSSDSGAYVGNDQDAQKKVAVVAVPLFYPVLDGRRVAVVSFASHSRLTWLTLLHNNDHAAHWLNNEVSIWWRGFLHEVVALGSVAETAGGTTSASALQ